MSRGTRVIDRICGPLGRLRLASGTHNGEEFRQLNGMVGQLIHDREWDLLKLLHDRHVSLRQLYLARWRGERLPNAKNLRPLKDALEAWLATYDGAESTKVGYAGIIARFTARHPGAPLGTVAELLLSEKGPAQAGPRASWNLLRAVLLSFLGDTLGKRHELYMAVQDVPPLKVKSREGNPQTVDQLRALVTALPDQADNLWGMALTGMRPGEWFAGRWEVLSDRVVVHGTKTDSAPRIVPRLYPLARPVGTYWRFVHTLHDLTKGVVEPHDLRRTFMVWAEDAGIPRTRRRQYLGHAVADVSELYERRRDLEPWLAADAEKLRTFVGDPREQRLQVVAGD